MCKNIFAFILFLLFSFKLVGQETTGIPLLLANDNTGPDRNVLYRNEASVGVFLHSAGGFGASYRRGKHVTARRKKMFEIEACNFRSSKEVKSINSYDPNSQSFYFGKLNSVTLIRSGVGYGNVLFNKTDKKSVEVRYCTFIGVTLAFAKPVYLEVESGTATTPTAQRYTPSIPIEDVYGKAPFFTGFNQTTIVPGAYAKFGLSFDFAERYDGIRAIEIGTIADIYPKPIEFMAYSKPQNLLLSLYLKMIWGKKWY